MNVTVADIIKGYIEPLPFIDKIAGLVRPITKVESLGDGRSIKKTFPVGCSVTHDQCTYGKLTELMPNSAHKSVTYFEDLGVVPMANDAGYFDFESRVKLVCWLNQQKLGKTSCSVSALAIAAILKALPQRNFTSGDYTRISISMVGQDPKSNAIFSKYSYDETVVQYLMYPYDYFAITLKTTFRIPYKCVDEWASSTAITCLDNGNT